MVPFCAALAVLGATHSDSARPAAGIIADYDAELRRPDGHVNTPAMVERLKALGANCYFWLIWHAPTDWDDLQEFLPVARDAGIDVWVYLVPPSEPPPSQPFGLDFITWAREIAKLSIQHPNLRAWVIDDFYANRSVLTPEYMAQVCAAAREINPNLAFYPLMYFPEIGWRFVEDYGPIVDGAVVAYPTGLKDIARAGRVLRGEPDSAQWLVTYPWEQPSAAGECATVSCVLTPSAGAPAHVIRFRQRDSFTGPTSGYHFKQALVDGEVVWEEDVAGGDAGWQQVALDVSEKVHGREKVRFSLRCFDKRGVGNFGVEVEWADVEVQGFDEGGEHLGTRAAWQEDVVGQWRIEWLGPRPGMKQRRLDYVVMIAANAYDLALRLPGSQGTPEELQAHAAEALQAMVDGHCDGFVTYCLPKAMGDPYFEAVRLAIAEARKAREPQR